MSEQKLIEVFSVKGVPGQDDLFIVECSVRGGQPSPSYMRLSTCEEQAKSTNDDVATVGQVCGDAIRNFVESQKKKTTKKKKAAPVADAPEDSAEASSSED